VSALVSLFQNEFGNWFICIRLGYGTPAERAELVAITSMTAARFMAQGWPIRKEI
jgi:hypothetical protein